MLSTKISGKFKVKTARFGTSTHQEISEILEGRNAKNTNKATKNSVSALKEYITEKQLPILEETLDCDLPDLLQQFYVDARKKNSDLYHTQTMKNIRSGLNRYFQEKRRINIINELEFSQANMVFKGVQVRAKKAGCGVRRSTPTIDDNDMKLLAKYFCIDHVSSPNAKVLQSNVIFNVIYYTCRWGQENLYEMTKDWFEVQIQKDGSKCIV